MRPMLIVYCDREVTSATMAAGERWMERPYGSTWMWDDGK